MAALELPTQTVQTWLMAIVAQVLCSLAWSLPSRNLGLVWVSDLVTLALTDRVTVGSGLPHLTPLLTWLKQCCFRQEETEQMKLEKWGELDSAQSAPLAVLMAELKGSDIPKQQSSKQQQDPSVKSDGSSDELHTAKQCLPGGHCELPPKRLSKG